MPTGALPVACVVRSAGVRLGSAPPAQPLVLPSQHLVSGYNIEFELYDWRRNPLVATAATLRLYDAISGQSVDIQLQVDGNKLIWECNPAQIPGQIGDGRIKQCAGYFIITAGDIYCSEEIPIIVYGHLQL